MNTINASSLGDLQWQHRLIVVFVPPDTSEHRDLVAWANANRCELEDRQTLVIHIGKQSNTELTKHGIELDLASVSTLSQQRRSIDAKYEMLLIGKDGGVKARSTSIVNLDAFIHQIDGMPMRRQEMKADRC